MNGSVSGFQRLASIPGLELAFDRPFFKEFTLKVRGDAHGLIEKAAVAGFGIGPVFDRFPGQFDPNLGAALLIAVTEKRTRDEIDRLFSALAS